ncbi:DUF2637 domain-containing protein [Streptomyces canus]|uniref:DUF2637 domain-containing protein n=1 Tax=Streptomyces canus TaxID=58343 RepID=UPI002E302A53|nr:DUF2637 domain-containing protein [Streptomyces canus]
MDEAPAEPATPRIELTRTHRVLIGVVIAGAVVIAAIGFAGSYAAVRQLALQKGFGWFANVFPIGIDAGIVVLLALDLLLTWLRIPFPLLRQTAWVLTAATIAFNAAAAWPDPLGVGMHAVIPVLFVVSVEAARHAVGRIADLTADRHMESVRIARWLLAPLPTFLLWRRMKLWELRSYDEVVRLEQARMVYRARLHARFGRGWRRKAPVEFVMPLRLARYGVALDPEQLAKQLANMDAQPIQPTPDIHASHTRRHEVEAGSPASGYTDESTYPLATGGQFPTPEISGAPHSAGDAEGGESLQDGAALPLPHQVDTYNEPRAASRETVMADRSRQPADTIHVRIPAQQDADEDPDEAEDEAEGAEAIDLTTMPGVEAVRLAYERLSPEEREQSDRQKATKIADMTGLAYNTVRRYLSDIRKAQRDEVSSAAPHVAPVPEPEGGWAILPPAGGREEARPATDQDPEVSTEDAERADAFTRHQ